MKLKQNTRRAHFSFFIFFACLFFSYASSARRFRDTVHFRATIAEARALVLSDSALNAIGIDSLLGKIENIHNTLDKINNATSTGFDTRDIESNLGEIDSNIDIIDENVALYTSVLDVKNLQMFMVLLGNLQAELSDYRTQVFEFSKDLNGMTAEMAAFRKDTILRALIADSAFRSLYLSEIKDLKLKWGNAKTAIIATTTRISRVQATLSNEYFATIDLQNKIKDLLKKTRVKALGKEYPFLWEKALYDVQSASPEQSLAIRSYNGQRKILFYYFKRNLNDQLWMIVLGAIFLIWININFRRYHKTMTLAHKHELSFRYIDAYPLLPTLVVLFNLAPFFDIHPPTAYVEIVEFLLVIALTFILKKGWPRKLFEYWLVLGVLYIVISIMGAVFSPTPVYRWCFVLLNVVSAVFGIFWLRQLGKNTLVFSRMIKFVSILYISLNIAGALCNVFGRISYAKMFSVTAIYSLAHIIGLSVFIRIAMEAFHLQTVVSKLGGGIYSKLNFTRINQLLSRAVMIISVVLWTIVFTISLNLYNLLFFQVSKFLTTPRSIGSTSFEIGSILLFILIIYISNLLQQGIGSLYGKSETEWDPQVKKNGSRLAMTRLVFIVLGFMIAVAASGLPIDKITIVLGALGVGIGLGLQTIINNLVSGVILIFEQPFRIGDFIELGDIKGRVLDIGIRSSKIVREEGAEVIMPNADLLSGRVINWTLRNDNVRIELALNIEGSHPFEDIKNLILTELKSNEHVVKTLASDIYLTSVTEKAMSIIIMVWINDVHQTKLIKSNLLNHIYGLLSAKDIKVL